MDNFIREVVKHYDHEINLKDKQLECFKHLLEGKDLIVNLPVGYGKSLIYHVLPKLLGTDIVNPVVLVVSPLNIIHKDQLKALLDHGISACRLDITGNVEIEDDEHSHDIDTKVNLDDVQRGRYSVVLCHPEAILNTRRGKQLLDSEEFKTHVIGIVVDECHIIENWGEKFRTAFKKLFTMKAFFPDVPLLALSGTLTKKQKENLPKLLGMQKYVIVETSPDRPNIFLEKREKSATVDVLSSYEDIFIKECDRLFELGDQYPVTLLFLPVFYMSEAVMYLNSLFGSPTIESSVFSAICSGQDEGVVSMTITELKKENPRIRLVLTTSIAGMGFDPQCVTRVIHACPPRNIMQYIQEIGRAGRRGQPATAILYYNKRDIAKNLPGLMEDIVEYCCNKSSCLRNNLLSAFGFSKKEYGEDYQCCSFCQSLCTT